jgi:spore maturation protein CgeB
MLGSVLKEKGVDFLFVDGKDVSEDEQVEIIQKSRINLSCVSAADSLHGFSWGLPERCYGIPACGGFLIMEERVHVKDDFSIGEDAVTYTDCEDCVRKILYFRERHDERRGIAERAYHRVMKEHTYTHRALRLIKEIQEQRSNVTGKVD